MRKGFYLTDSIVAQVEGYFKYIRISKLDIRKLQRNLFNRNGVFASMA